MRAIFAKPETGDTTTFWAGLRAAYPDAMTDTDQFERAAADAAVLYIAGYDNLANCIMHTLCALAIDQDSQAAVAEVRCTHPPPVLRTCMPILIPSVDDRRTAVAKELACLGSSLLNSAPPAATCVSAPAVRSIGKRWDDSSRCCHVLVGPASRKLARERTGPHARAAPLKLARR